MMRRLLLLWFLAALFCLAAVGAVLMIFSSGSGLESRLIALVFAAVFLYMAFHFASMAVHPPQAPDEQTRRQEAARVAGVTQLPVVASPEGLALQGGEVCHFQSPAQVLEEPGKAKWVSTARTYPGDFSITNQRLVMTGRKKFKRPLSALTGISMYQQLQGVCLEFGGDSYILLMDEPYWVPKILELLGKQL